MAQFHFVEDYEKLVTDLVNAYPMDEAMSRAVGGNYELVGRIEAALLSRAGLEEGMQLVDLGCGSGRLAFALHDTTHISYVGIDIVQALLDYAKTKAPGYEFILHRELSIPQPDNSADMVIAFSLFTHLLHTESYLYLEECVRILKPGGKIVFSFLEFAEPAHWEIFSHTCQATKLNALPHLNTFIERGAIDIWASNLGLAVEYYIAATEPVLDSHAPGQSVVVLRKRFPSEIKKIIGFLDYVNKDSISGWAADTLSPESIEVELRINNQSIATQKADMFREDIEKLGLNSTGNCGFLFRKFNTFELRDQDIVQVVVKDYKHELNNSPRVFRKPKNIQIKNTFSQLLHDDPEPLLSQKNKLGLLWSAKSGCTFFLKWFFFQENLLDKALLHNSWIHEYREEKFYYSDEYVQAVQELGIRPYYWIKTVRSPFSRAVSSYIHAVKFQYEDVYISRFLGGKNIKEEGYSFNEFLSYLESIDIVNCNMHHKIQVHSLESKNVIVPDKLIKLENSMEELIKLEEELDLPKAPLHLFRESDHHTRRISAAGFVGNDRFSRNHTTWPDHKYFYNDYNMKNVVNIYKKDFELYDYPVDIV